METYDFIQSAISIQKIFPQYLFVMNTRLSPLSGLYCILMSLFLVKFYTLPLNSQALSRTTKELSPHTQCTHPHTQCSHPHTQCNNPHPKCSHPHTQYSHPYTQFSQSLGDLGNITLHYYLQTGRLPD